MGADSIMLESVTRLPNEPLSLLLVFSTRSNTSRDCAMQSPTVAPPNMKERVPRHACSLQIKYLLQEGGEQRKEQLNKLYVPWCWMKL